MDGDPRFVSLSSLADGAAEDLFEAAFQRALENIEDPNSDWKTARVITLRFTISPDEQRRAGKIAVACSTKLAGGRAISTNVVIGRHKGVLAAAEARQADMFPEPVGVPRPVEVKTE